MKPDFGSVEIALEIVNANTISRIRLLPNMAESELLCCHPVAPQRHCPCCEGGNPPYKSVGLGMPHVFQREELPVEVGNLNPVMVNTSNLNPHLDQRPADMPSEPSGASHANLRLVYLLLVPPLQKLLPVRQLLHQLLG